VGITTIGTNAFNSTYHIQVPDGALSNLTTLDGGAFYHAGPGVYLSSIPAGVSKIPGWTFAYCDNVVIQDFSGVN
jgi:hypothetical protein